MPVSYSISNLDVAEITIVNVQFGSTWLNVLHYLANTATPVVDGPGELDQLIREVAGTGAVSGKWDALNVLLSSQSQHTSSRGQIILPNRRPYIQLTEGVNGGSATEAMPTNVAAVLTKVPTIAGRGRSGSIHLAGIPRDQVTNASLVSSFRTALQTAGDAFADAIPGLDTALNWVPLVGKTPTGGVYNELAQIRVQETSRVVRRRTFLVGI
jgi:hypothetical protein